MRFFIFLIFCPVILLAQSETIVTGKVLDRQTKEPLPFVSMGWLNANGGSTTNFEGRFKIQTSQHVDSLVVTYVGYQRYSCRIRRGVKQNLTIELIPLMHEMKEAVVKPGVNPALRIINEARKNKHRFNQDNLTSYRYGSYSKVQVSLTNISDQMKNRKIFQPLSGLFDTINQLRNAEGNHIVPIFMSETVSKYYYLKRLGKGKEVIESSNTHGVGVTDNSYLEDLTGGELHHLNLNDNFVRYLNKDLISPLSDDAHFFYIYTLLDSLEIDGMKCYQIRLDLRRKKDLGFEGTIWIADSLFALKQVSLELGPEANINYVHRIQVQQELQPTSGSGWITSKSRIVVEFDRVTKEGSGMVVGLYNSYSDIETGIPLRDDFFDVIIDHAETEVEKDSSYWLKHRSEELSLLERRMFHQVDSINNLSVVKRYVDWGHTLVEGHKRVGPLEIGPYTAIVSYNKVEGTRFRLGFKTNLFFSKRWILNSYVAYGDRDEAFKYRVGADYIANAKHWRVFSFRIRNDNDLLGVTTSPISYLNNNGIFTFFNFFSNRVRINRTEEVNFSYASNLNSDWSLRLIVNHSKFTPQGDFRFLYQADREGKVIPSTTFTNAEMGVELRWAFREVMVTRGHDRIRIERAKRPVIILAYRKGIRGIEGSDFNYHRVGLVVAHHMNTRSLGTADWQLYSGTVLGRLPYPLLDVARGNESPIYSENNYNLMNFYEFVSDRFVHLRYTQHFEGLLLNWIPLVNRLDLRNYAQVKMAYGSLNNQNRSCNPAVDDPAPTQLLSPVNGFQKGKPYTEVAYGFENIFEFFSLGLVHRLTYKSLPHVRTIGVNVGVSVRF